MTIIDYLSTILRRSIYGSIMRYSQIIGEGFHHIKLTPKKYSLVDGHFLAASHHRYCVLDGDLTTEEIWFHERLYWDHLVKLMSIVEDGDFSEALDLTRKGLSKPQGWNITDRINHCRDSALDYDYALPDPEMFNSMVSADSRFKIGDDHPYDYLLTNSISPSFIFLNVQAV